MAGSNTAGYVYILESANTDCIKIGGTGVTPMIRVQEINATPPYKALGPWHLSDFRQVVDWRLVEHFLHETFTRQRVYDIQGQKELFRTTVKEASERLRMIDSSQLIGKQKVDRMFVDEPFRAYLLRLFLYTGLAQWMDYQGAWTLCLFPATERGRFFTINIASHEVAFSTLPHRNEAQVNMLYMDESILSVDETVSWIDKHHGEIKPNCYDTALSHGVAVHLSGDFHVMSDFMAQQGVRRAVLAYWTEGLLTLKERNRMSSYARWHNYNAAATIGSMLRDIV